MTRLTAFFIMPFMALLFLWGGGFAYFNYYIKTIPVPSEKSEKEALIVLTGGPQRIDAGLSALKAGHAPKLFISGVHDKVSPADLWGEDTPACCITLGHQAHNTRQNAEETAQWAQENKANDIFLITAAYHMPRALLEFKDSMPEGSITPYPVHTQAPAQSNTEYHRLVLSEYHKTILTKLRLCFKKKK